MGQRYSRRVSVDAGETLVVGVDLAGSTRRPTGICLLQRGRLHAQTEYQDEAILALIPGAAPPPLVAVDAPLALPRERCCLRDHCSCFRKGHFRQCDLELRRLGVRFFPITLGPMRTLTERGMALKARLADRGCTVIETYPGGAQDLWGIPRQKDAEGLRRALRKIAPSTGLQWEKLTVHEMDAICCALVGALHLQGRSLMLGVPDEALLILPDPGDGGSRLRRPLAQKGK